MYSVQCIEGRGHHRETESQGQLFQVESRSMKPISNCQRETYTDSANKTHWTGLFCYIVAFLKISYHW